MSKQLYEEAIADLKKVKEIAEDNAKRAVVEAVAPRIRELIEKELLGESLNEDESSEDEEKKDKILIDEPTPQNSNGHIDLLETTLPLIPRVNPRLSKQYMMGQPLPPHNPARVNNDMISQFLNDKSKT